MVYGVTIMRPAEFKMIRRHFKIPAQYFLDWLGIGSNAWDMISYVFPRKLELYHTTLKATPSNSHCFAFLEQYKDTCPVCVIDRPKEDLTKTKDGTCDEDMHCNLSFQIICNYQKLRKLCGNCSLACSKCFCPRRICRGKCGRSIGKFVAGLLCALLHSRHLPLISRKLDISSGSFDLFLFSKKGESYGLWDILCIYVDCIECWVPDRYPTATIHHACEDSAEFNVSSKAGEESGQECAAGNDRTLVDVLARVEVDKPLYSKAFKQEADKPIELPENLCVLPASETHDENAIYSMFSFASEDVEVLDGYS
ncbi:hypothetical protein TWF173_002061 [Orbilia oligospora]|nr:hypothetical protein TWF173_002061 [Orbilia oligospora]